MYASLQALLSGPVAAAERLIDQGFNGAASLALAFFVLLLAAAIWMWRRPAQKARTNVTARRAFSQAQGLLWSRLSDALPEHVVLMSVPVSRFISVRQAGGLGRNQRKLEALTVDYGIFRSDGTVSSVVILEGTATSLTRRQTRLRGKLLDRAAIRTATWDIKPLPTTEMISRLLNPVPIQFAAAERGVAQRNIPRTSPGVFANDAMAPDTRLAASHASPDIRPAQR
jgi:hypothetical protein